MTDPSFISDLTERTIVIGKPTRTVTTNQLETQPFTIRVPRLFGEIEKVEQRGNYVIVLAEHGKAAYHLTRGAGSLSATNRIGFMAWHSLRKTIRKLCLRPEFAKRVDMQVVYYRNGRGNSADGAHGRITVDRSIIVEGRDIAHGLGKSLEAYLHLSTEARLSSDDEIIRSFALLDRNTPNERVPHGDPNDPTHPLWSAFVRLRTEPQ